MNFLTVNWNEILDAITSAETMAETILPGLFTLTGSALGAFLAGRYAVNAVTSQLNYDKNNKRIDILDNDLKIGNEFTIRLNLLISEIKKNEKVFLPNESIKISRDLDDHINSIKELESYTKEVHDYLSILQINNIPFEDYRKYKNALLSVYELNLILTNIGLGIKYQKHILNNLQKYEEKTIKNIENDIKDDYINFKETRNKIIEEQKEIQKSYLYSTHEYKILKEKINKITKN